MDYLRKNRANHSLVFLGVTFRIYLWMSKIIIALYVLAASVGLIILKVGTNSGLPVSYDDNKLQFNLNPQTLLGLFLFGLSFILYVYLIARNEISYITPLLAAFVYILVFLASFLFLKEAFTATKIIGIVLILAGIILLNLKR